MGEMIDWEKVWKEFDEWEKQLSKKRYEELREPEIEWSFKQAKIQELVDEQVKKEIEKMSIELEHLPSDYYETQEKPKAES